MLDAQCMDGYGEKFFIDDVLSNIFLWIKPLPNNIDPKSITPSKS